MNYFARFAGQLNKSYKTKGVSIIYRLAAIYKISFICPICKYHGPFVDLSRRTGVRKHAKCPKCGSLERHRLQALVMQSIADEYELTKMSLLHFAPESFFQSYFKETFSKYHTADRIPTGVLFSVDLRHLPFQDKSYDCVYASHVLEHIKEDRLALSEIRRILKPGGFAILPVPILADTTVEYPQQNRHESGHVRAPGLDYFDRYLEFFDEVKQISSEDYPKKYQLFNYEDRSTLPNQMMPYRLPMKGEKHIDIVPICRVRH